VRKEESKGMRVGGVVEARHCTTNLVFCGALVNGPNPSHHHRDLDRDAVSNAELAYTQTQAVESYGHSEQREGGRG